MNTASRASSTSASSHLVQSKHDAKCRRVPRIISRRLYCYRRKVAETESPAVSPDVAGQPNGKDFSPRFNELSTFGETILNFLAKYPHRRSYSTDSDPLVKLRSEMNKTAYFNHNLMKRRYSVPETIMRKHKLQELMTKTAQKPSEVKDSSCQTEEAPDTRRVKKSSKRKRDRGLSYLKKSNTYCQYKSYLHKKKYREIKSGTSATEDSNSTSPLTSQSISTSLPILVEPKKSYDKRQVSAPSSSEEFEKLVIKESKKSTLHPLRQPSQRQFSAPESDSHENTNKVLHAIRQSSAPSSSDEKVPRDGKLFEPSKRVHIKNFKSLDQNTSGYNTVCGSLDDFTTPRKKTPESSKVCTMEEHPQDGKGKMYPITFHSESVFLHPCQQGIISHKQFHQISIQMPPEESRPQKPPTEPESSKNDYYKTEIKLNVNDADADAKHPKTSNQHHCSDIHNDSVKDKPTLDSQATTPRADTKGSPSPTAQITEVTPSPRLPDPEEDYDCSVPATYPIKSDKSNLKIEVDVGNVDDVRSNLRQILLGQRKPPEEPCKPKPDTKYNSKAALNYLFQKLGDSYPRRYLLKQPVYEYKPQFGKYYSELPKPERSEIPSKVLFNNQTYNILSGNLLPNEWSTVNPTDEHLSDSDISIPDSLEDFQQHQRHAKHKHNKYDKYDDKITRGDVTVKPPVKASKHKGVSYFIPLLDSNKTKPIMPAELRKKLCRRNDTLPKHSLCSDLSPRKSPHHKLIHKQIQTCLNSEDSLKKRRKKFAERATESQTELDEKIKNILLTGIEPSDQRLVEHSPKQTSQFVQTDSSDPVIGEYVEMFDVQAPSSTESSKFFENDHLYEIILSEEEVGRVNSNNFYRSFKKCRRIYCPNKPPEVRVADEKRSNQNSNIPTYSGHKKLKEFKKQNIDISPATSSSSFENQEPSTELLPLPYPRMKKTREKPKTISKIPGPKRFYQKFEAIPEELSNSSDGALELQLSGNSDENNESMPADINEQHYKLDENKNHAVESSAKNLSDLDMNKVNDAENYHSKPPDENDSEHNGIEPKSQKARDSLLASEHEELITLSKGWINFYLLKGASVEEQSAPEDNEDDVALSETIQIPQQYTISVHATPETSNPLNSSLPGLYKSKKLYKCEKLNEIRTSLPDITSNQVTNAIPQYTETANSISNRTNQLVRDATKAENSISTVTTSSNRSESPCEELPGRNIRKFQRYQRPHTYHSARATRNQWSLTLKGSNDDRHANDIEMQLSLQNAAHRYLPSNQTWKLTLKSENTETSRVTRSSKHLENRGHLPHLNVNYKMLPSPNYQQENITANHSENNSGSSSTISCSGRKYKLDSELLLQNVTRLNNDLKVQIRHSDDDLTIRGSAITPERRPKVPTMSERDLTRMRLIRQTSADTRL